MDEANQTIPTGRQGITIRFPQREYKWLRDVHHEHFVSINDAVVEAVRQLRARGWHREDIDDQAGAA